VKLGTSVSQIALRPPVLMARELATLDRLSKGRLIVGAGAGWVPEEFNSTGVPFEDRGGRLNEVLRLLRHLWTTPDQGWHGKYFDIPPIGIIRPLTAGGPPIIVGAMSEPGLRRAARYADGFISVSSEPERIVAAKARIDELRSKYGRMGPFPVYAQVAPPEDTSAAKATVASYAEAGCDHLILTYAGDVISALHEAEHSARALIECGVALEH